jgi:hypothetical protein
MRRPPSTGGGPSDKEAEMADANGSEGGSGDGSGSGGGTTDLASEIMRSYTALTDVEVAIQQGLKSFVETADQEIKNLLQTNVVPPDVRTQMQDLQKSVINMTIDIIKNNASVVTKDDSGGSS